MLTKISPEAKTPDVLLSEIPQARYIDAYAPNETIESLLELDIDTHVAAGRTNLVLDAEGTFVQYDGWRVDDEIVDWFATVRGKGIENIIITTNKAAKDQADVWQMQAWAEQIGADALFSPLDSSQRKPSPYMLLSAMQSFDIQADSMLSVGDKLHGDVLASNLARVHSVYLRQPHGKSDHPGDRFIKRPFIEKPLYMATKNTVPSVKFEDKSLEDVECEAIVQQNPRGIELDQYVVNSGLLIGIATQPEALRAEYLAKMPPPQFEQAKDTIGRSVSAVKKTKVVSNYLEHLRANGEDHAEWLTEQRKKVLSPVIGGLTLSGGLAEIVGMKKASRALLATAMTVYAASHVTDGLDGLAIRMSGADLKSERRIEGAEEDRLADQEVSEKTGWGLVLGLRKDPFNQLLQSYRVKLRRNQTKEWTNKGFDTKSDRVSKFANEFQGVADTRSLKKGLTLSTVMTQTAATIFKYGSMINSEKRIWPYRKARLQAAEEVKTQLKN